MKLKYFVWSTVLFLGAVVGVSAQNFAIEPGSRIGKIELGVSRNQVQKLLGKPAVSVEKEDPHYLLEVWPGKGTGNHLFITYRNGLVWQIEVMSAKFSTPEGLTTQSTLREIRKHYKNLNRRQYFKTSGEGYAVDYYDDAERGIAFKFINLNSDEKPDDFQLSSIIVHEAGETVLPDDREDPQ